MDVADINGMHLIYKFAIPYTSMYFSFIADCYELSDCAMVCCWQHGGDINARDHTGQTALHWSAVKGAIQVAELLLQEGARVGAADLNGYQVSFYILLLLIANNLSKL